MRRSAHCLHRQATLRDHGPGYKFIHDRSLRELFGMLDDFTPDFEIVEPGKASVQ
jgi:hypothetical protein